jgi:hypothetical protein
MAAMTATATGAPLFEASTAVAAAIAMTAPTDKSTPPVAMTSVMPIERSMTREA